MEISAEKHILMTNSANGIQREIKVKGQKLVTVTGFTYLGAVVSSVCSKPEILSRIAQATAALRKPKPIWKNNISLESNVKLIRSLVISIFLKAFESGTLTAEFEERTNGRSDEMLLETIEHFVQGPCHQCRGSHKEPGIYWTIR